MKVFDPILVSFEEKEICVIEKNDTYYYRYKDILNIVKLDTQLKNNIYLETGDFDLLSYTYLDRNVHEMFINNHGLYKVKFYTKSPMIDKLFKELEIEL